MESDNFFLLFRIFQTSDFKIKIANMKLLNIQCEDDDTKRYQLNWLLGIDFPFTKTGVPLEIPFKKSTPPLNISTNKYKKKPFLINKKNLSLSATTIPLCTSKEAQRNNILEKPSTPLPNRKTHN